MDQFHPTIIQNNLKVAILEADEESEKVVEEFLQSKYTTAVANGPVPPHHDTKQSQSGHLRGR